MHAADHILVNLFLTQALFHRFIDASLRAMQTLLISGSELGFLSSFIFYLIILMRI